MQTDSLGIPIYSKQDILDIIYQGKIDLLGSILVNINDRELAQFNSAAQDAGESTLTPYTPLDINIQNFD